LGLGLCLGCLGSGECANGQKESSVSKRAPGAESRINALKQQGTRVMGRGGTGLSLSRSTGGERARTASWVRRSSLFECVGTVDALRPFIATTHGGRDSISRIHPISSNPIQSNPSTHSQGPPIDIDSIDRSIAGRAAAAWSSATKRALPAASSKTPARCGGCCTGGSWP